MEFRMNTSKHKQIAIEFLQMIVAGQIHEAYQKYVSPEMKHHNVAFPGDAASLEEAMEENQVQFPNKLFDVKKAIEEDDLVVVYSHLRLKKGDRGFSVMHMLRFRDDRIIEMWDIAQAIPEDSPNENGAF